MNNFWQAFKNSQGDPAAFLAPADADMKAEDYSHYKPLTGKSRNTMLEGLGLPSGPVDAEGAPALSEDNVFAVGANKGKKVIDVMAAAEAAAADIQVGADAPA